MVIPNRDECIQSDMLAARIEKSVDELSADASDEAYHNICYLMDEGETVSVAMKNQRIFILETFGTILRTELEKQIRPNIFEGRNTTKLITLYKKTVLLLRRIEFDFPLEYQMELFHHINRERMSILAVVGIIQSCNCLVDKNKIRNGLVEVLRFGENNE